MDDIRLRSDPIAITVTLLRDGVVEVLSEDIILTLVQDSRTESNNNQLLIYYDTIRDLRLRRLFRVRRLR